jgi:hypothetical protein
MRALPKAMLVGDVDADGKADVVLSYANDANWDALYGRGDGTFAAPATIRATANPLAIRTADLDNNGQGDLVAIDAFGRATVVRNLGNRSFGDPLLYSSPYFGYDITTAELTGDANLDVAAALDTCSPRTWTGTGLGTLTRGFHNEPGECWFDSPTRAALAAADFDGDGRTDIVQSRIGFAAETKLVTIYRNRCGESIFTAATGTPTINPGQTVTVTATVEPPAEASMWLAATGSATLQEGSTVLGTANFDGLGKATFNLSGLALGDHSLVAKFAGDQQYEPVQSAPLVVHVTNETTTTTLTVAPEQGFFGAPTTITARVTSSTGDTPSGVIRFTIDGLVPSHYPADHAPLAVTGVTASVGTHTYTAEFLGDATHPPSSATTTYVVRKVRPEMTVTPAQSIAGTNVTLRVALSFLGGQTPGGTVTGTFGNATLSPSTMPDYNVTTGWELGPLAAGRYDVRLHYSGDANYEPSDVQSVLFVFAPTGFHVEARGAANGVSVVSTKDGNVISGWRRRPSETSWTHVAGPYGGYVDKTAEPETVYLYRNRGYDNTDSDVDVGMRIAFTDDALLPGTVIRAAHLQEIIRGANILRAAAGLPALTLTVAPGDVVSAAHVAALRDGINQARVAVGAYSFPFEGTIAAGAPVRARDIQDLREAIR